MKTPALSHIAMVKEARKDLPELHRRFKRTASSEDEQFIDGTGVGMPHQVTPWRSSRGNDWLVHERRNRKGSALYSMLVFKDSKGRSAGLWTQYRGVSVVIDAQVMERYVKRFHGPDQQGTPVLDFFKDNQFFPLQTEQELDGTHWNMTIGLKHGLGMGVWDMDTDIVFFNTLLINGKAFQEKTPVIGADAFGSAFWSLGSEERKDFLLSTEEHDGGKQPTERAA